MLKKRIKSLRTRLEQTKDSALDEPLRLENLGLLASAHKRLAELIFLQGAEGAEKRSRKTLEAAAGFYFQAHDCALSHHWTGTQHLAISAALSGRIPQDRSVHWLAALHAAELEAGLDPYYDDDTCRKVLWALGSIAELCLLAPLTSNPEPAASDRAESAIRRLVELETANYKKHYAINSTWRQFRRYVNWWTVDHGFFSQDAKDMSQEASQLAAILEPHVQK
jgi:hypothetical protein